MGDKIMSLWTHVNGSLRVKNMKAQLGKKSVKKYKKELESLFKTVSFYDESKKWKQCNVPCGSEGSLSVSIWVSEEGDLSTINFFGDLRGFYNDLAIIEWIDNIIADNSFFIRDGVMTVNGKVYVYKEERDDKTFDIVKQGFELVLDI